MTEILLSSMLDGFSYPQSAHVSDLDDLVPLVVREYAAGITGVFLTNGIDALEPVSDGLIDYIASWIADPAVAPGQDVGWDYAFGDAYRTAHNVGGDPVTVAAAVALHLGARGHAGSWAVDLPQPCRLRWDGILLPEVDRLRVSSDDSSARIDYIAADGPGTAFLTEADGRWRTDAGPELAPLLHVDRHDVRFEVLVRDALAMRDYEDLLQRARPDVDPRMLEVFDQALDIVAGYAPEYLRWIARTVHQLFLLDPRPGRVESGSVEHYLGLVHLTEHPEPLPVAELLAHEATHQYMNVAAKLEPLDDGTDTNVYWSPAVQTERPVSKIVAAFHAFGNVLLFYRHCRAAGIANTGECDRQEALLGSWMNDLVPPVKDNPALTRTGNALCRPLLSALGFR